MAITNNGTKVSLPTNKIPTGFPVVGVTTFEDELYVRPLTLLVDKATVDNADDKVTLQNIISDAGIGIDKQVADLIALDYIATRTVETFAEWTDVDTNIVASNTTDFLNDNGTDYVCTVLLKIKTAA